MNKILIHTTKYIKKVAYNFKKKPRNLLFLFTEGRGGGTWLMESLQSNLKAISIFEPLDGRNIKIMGIKKRLGHQFDIVNKKDADLLYDYLSLVLGGTLYDCKPVMFNTIWSVLHSKVAVVKFVNNTLLIPFILRNFTSGFKPIYIARNPIDILNSRINYGYRFHSKSHKLTRNEIHNFFSKKAFRSYIYMSPQIETNYELWILEICCYIDFAFRLKKNLNFVVYEKLRLKESSTIKMLRDEYFISDFDMLDRFSASTHKMRQLKKDAKKSNFSEEQISKFQCIIDRMRVQPYAR